MSDYRELVDRLRVTDELGMFEAVRRNQYAQPAECLAAIQSLMAKTGRRMKC